MMSKSSNHENPSKIKVQTMEGYKLTEVGVIPEDWELVPLVEIAQIATGTTPPTNDRANYGDKFLFAGPSDLGKTKWIVNTEKKLSSKGFALARKFPEKSILFTCIGSTIGKAGMASTELTSNQQINAVFPNENYTSEYLYYQLNLLSKFIKRQAGEQAVPLINKTKFGEFQIPLPPTKAEQTAIATALSDMDALIEGLEKLLVKKRNIKQGAMQRCLNPDFKDFQDDPDFKKSSNQNNQWEVKTLGEICEIKKGQLITNNTRVNGEIPVIAGGKTPAYY
ncbi:MAG: restriction endonuclease subunit S, partial [Deltaproteobacteria bacterium]|nr:restriction endonuclease subunit S [Deltaproteobacteria bacterium]